MSRAGLITSQEVGESRFPITGGLPMRLAFVGYKSYLFHRQIRAYEVDIGY
jgi:hypothetical protein